MTELTILDVGHGNCAVITRGNSTIVIDACPGLALVEFLREAKCTAVEAVLLSHADADHMGGAVHLLSQPDIHVASLYVSQDADKRSDLWADFQMAAYRARLDGGPSLSLSLTASRSGRIASPEMEVEVLWPFDDLELFGVGQLGPKGKRFSSNSLSSVIGLCVDGVRQVLFAADIDEVALDYIQEDGIDMRATVLVFPHHGGQPGRSDARQFAQRLCAAVMPDVVIFSNGRQRRYNAPHPDIVAGVRSAVPNARIACTQLSYNCHDDDKPLDQVHLSILPARGKSTAACCAGTLSILLGGAAPEFSPHPASHSAFIRSNVLTPMCIDCETP